MKRRGIFALCLLASIIMFGCASTSVESSSDVSAKIARFSVRKKEFRLAIEKGNMRKVARLIKKSSFHENRYGLLEAISLDSLKAVKVFLGAGVDINTVYYVNVGEETPLLAACQSRKSSKRYDVRYDIVKLLLENGADVNIQQVGYGWTDLLLLLKNGADVNQSEETRSFLMKLQLEEGVNANVIHKRHSEPYHGKSALHYAVESGRDDIVKLLIQYGADVNVQYDGKTLLYWAQTKNKNAEIVKMLRDAGAKTTEKEELAIQKAIEAEKLKKQKEAEIAKKEAEIAKLKENLKRGSDNFYKEVIYRRGTPIKTGDEFLIDKNRIEVLDRTTSQAGYTYLVTYYSSAFERSVDYANRLMGGGAKYCFYIVSKREIALHQDYSFTNKEQYVTSVNDLKLTCIGKGKYQRNYQDVECYMFALDAEL